MIFADSLVLTDFGVCLLVELVSVILFERQRSCCGGILAYCTRFKCWDRVLLGQLLSQCLPVTCLHWKVYVGILHGLGIGVTMAGWDVESLDGLLIMLAIKNIFQVACLRQM